MSGWALVAVAFAWAVVFTLVFVVAPAAVRISTAYRRAYDALPALSRRWTMTLFDQGLLAERADGFGFLHWSALTGLVMHKDIWTLTFSSMNALSFKENAFLAKRADVRAFIRAWAPAAGDAATRLEG